MKDVDYEWAVFNEKFYLRSRVKGAAQKAREGRDIPEVTVYVQLTQLTQIV